MNKLLFFVFFSLSMYISAQNKISSYEYAIVADRFQFLKQTDQHKTSSLTKFLLDKIGLKTFFASDPQAISLMKDRCQFLFVDAQSDSGFFMTKIKLEFKDCTGRVVYTTTEGKSRKKAYGKAYHEAIRNALKDPVIQAYQFVKQKNEPIKEVTTILVAKPSAVTVSDQMPDQKANIAVQEASTQTARMDENLLYAQTITNGFQLVNKMPKLVFTILETSTPNLYVIQDYNGVLYLKGTVWVAEYYKDGERMEQELQIKF